METPPLDLITYSRQHLFHEFKMFWWLKENIPSYKDGYMHDALVESFVLHLRNLIHFLCRKRQRPDDVIAEDFIDNHVDWAKSKSPKLEEARIRADKELSHLTYKRKNEDDAEKKWDIDGLFGEIAGLAKEFVAQASEKKLHADVKELVNTPADQMVAFLGKHSYSSNVTAPVTFSRGLETSRKGS